MLSPKQTLFLSSLRGHPRKRIPYPAVVKAFLTCWSEYDDANRNYHFDVMKQISVLTEMGFVTLPKQKTNWDHIATPNRPTWVNVIPETMTAESSKRSIVSWRPELAEIQLQLTSNQRDILACINDWLIANQSFFIPVPHRERALEIFGNEHFFDNHGWIKNGGLFGGKVPLGLFGALDVGDPLPFVRPPDHLMSRGKPVLVVENQHSFWSFRTQNAKNGWYAAVAYSAGTALLTRVKMLDEVGEQVGTTTFHYLGDVDPPGLDFPCMVNMRRREEGLPPLLPATSAYRWLLIHGKRTEQSKDKRIIIREDSIAWLGDAHLQEQVAELFNEGKRIPQESLGSKQIGIKWAPNDR